MDEKTSLIGLSLEHIAAAYASIGLPRYRAAQCFSWIYGHGVTDFHAMSNLSKADKTTLDAHFSLARPVAERTEHSHDGTIKWLVRFADGNKAETVFIPEEDRGTLCISSQVGCTLTCTFCHTGTQKLVRNLTAGEILGQIMLARDVLKDWHAENNKHRLTNIVLMGMGEPLFNYENVKAAIQIAMDANGLAFSRKKITLSTSGHVPFIIQCAEDLGVNLAISLHAVRDELRNVLVPLNKRWNIKELLEACRIYAAKHPRQRITFEYVMLDGVNDSDAEAKELVRLIKGIPTKVNLIPFNPWPDAPYVRSTPERIASFAAIVQKGGYMSPVRTPRGEDILAACGQLKSDSEKHKKSVS
jgi:23S rRNA (adenine2503-C2)-methyltransferase